MFEGAIQDLIDELGRLPGIGPRSAQRIAFHLLDADSADTTRLADALTTMKATMRWCDRCFNISQEAECTICRDPRRDPQLVCVVAESRDVSAVERTREFPGRYHVLGGVISPLDGVGPDELHIKELIARIDAEGLTELIIAISPTTEGDATISYLTRLLAPLTKVTRIASGLPVGGDLDYTDEVTLGRALAGRVDAGA